jgi:hypothetical protein
MTAVFSANVAMVLFSVVGMSSPDKQEKLRKPLGQGS